MGSALAPTTARRVAAVAASWLGEGRRVVRVLLVEVDGSAPLAAGASMLVNESGEIEGSITGGCIEAAVATEAQGILDSGGPPRLLTYGVSDELAGTVGLSCGGIIAVFAHELRGGAAAVEAEASAAIAAGDPVAVATLLDGEGAGAKLAVVGDRALGTLGGELLDRSVRRDAAGLLAQGATAVRRYGADGSTVGAARAVHISSFAPPARMLIFGAIDFTAALTQIARDVGYRVIVCDPRRPFVETARFADADEIRICWPAEAVEGLDLGPRDAVLVFTHDPKFDVPAIRAALATGVGYLGALGSRRTTAERHSRLLEAGCSTAELTRLRAPCGLDLGGITPEEVAISVMAEIVAARRGRSGEPLSGLEVAIHGP